MFPDFAVAGFSLYEVFFGIGVLSALVMLKILSNKSPISNKVYNFYVVLIAVSILLGFVSAALFQSLFTFLKTGKADVFNDGVTFYGGLVGGIGSFFLLNILFGKIFFKNYEHFKELKYLVRIAPSCITAAHFFGRLGCLSVGCCHGNITTGFGIRMWVDEIGRFEKCVPIQLYEAAFLLVICIVITVLYFKNIHCELEIYCISYGVWRFIIEFFRGDERGSSFVKFLSPSQCFAIIFILVGLVIVGYKYYAFRHNKKKA